MTQTTLQYFLSLPYTVQRRVIVDPVADHVRLSVAQWPGCEAAGTGDDEARRALHLAMIGWLKSRARERAHIPLPDGTLKIAPPYKRDVRPPRTSFAGATR